MVFFSQWEEPQKGNKFGTFLGLCLVISSVLCVVLSLVGFYGIVEAGQHVHAQCFAEAPGAGDEHHLDSRSVQYFPDQAGFIDVIASALSDLFARIKQQRIPR